MVAGRIFLPTKLYSKDPLHSLSRPDGCDFFSASNHTEEDIVVEGNESQCALSTADRMKLVQVDGSLLGELNHASRSYICAALIGRRQAGRASQPRTAVWLRVRVSKDQDMLIGYQGQGPVRVVMDEDSGGHDGGNYRDMGTMWHMSVDGRVMYSLF